MSVGEVFQKTDTVIDRAYGRLCEMRMMLLQVVLDVLKVIGGGDSPADTHGADAR
jgi:hypothetical protein